MKFLNHIKHIFLFLLTFLIGVQIAYPDELDCRKVRWLSNSKDQSLGAIKVSDVDYSNDKVTIEKRIATSIHYPVYNPYGITQPPSIIWENYGEPLELDPFALVLFFNDSKYQIIAEGISGSQIGNGAYLVPALFLEYTDQKKFNEDAQFAIEIGFDVVTAVSSGGTLLIAKHLTKLRKLWLIFEVANSSVNILINYSDIKDDPHRPRLSRAVTRIW